MLDSGAFGRARGLLWEFDMLFLADSYGGDCGGRINFFDCFDFPPHGKFLGFLLSMLGMNCDVCFVFDGLLLD